MRTLFLTVCVVLAPLAGAHDMEEHGNITTIYPDEAGTGILAVVEETAPGALPNGVFYYNVSGVQGGDAFTVIADDGQSRCLTCCNAGAPPDGYDNGTPIDGGPLDKHIDYVLWWAEDPVERGLFCAHPDFDVHFSAGGSFAGYGNEAGTVPGDGDAVVVIFYGDAGEGFTYAEA